MCGLIGWIGERRRDGYEAIVRAVPALHHRGPDASAVERIAVHSAPSAELVFGHTRLAILDLSEAGRQPMHDPDTGNVLIYNGEVYNFRAIRCELESQGVGFRSTGDTEVVLKAYGRWGARAFERFAGMFALAIWDGRAQSCVLARDALGIKPLYYHAGPDGFWFASEVRAVLATGRVARRLDTAALHTFLGYGAVQAPLTLVRDVFSLPPGTSMTVSSAGVAGAPATFWRPRFAVSAAMPPDQRATAKRLRDVLTTVVGQHLISDVPLGAFLSGGVDSSSVVNLMRQAAVGPVHTFSVGFAEREYSEHEYARLVARRFGTEHTEISVSDEECLALLPAALAAQDQPTIDGVNVFVISRAVRAAGITVALSGQGGDELFAGYSTFADVERVVRYRRLLTSLPPSARRAVGRLWKAVRGRRLIGDKRAAILAGDGDVLGVYLTVRELYDADTRARLAGRAEAGERLVAGLPAEVHRALAEAVAGLDVVNQVSLLELRTYLASMLLRDGDFMSMAHSLEVRVPFLDHRVVDLVASLPGTLKVAPGRVKPLLLDAMGDSLPREVYERPKRGFTFPWAMWLKGRLRDVVASALGVPDAGVALGLAPGACRALWRAFLEGRSGVTWSRVWALFVLITWCRDHEVAP